MMRHISEGLGEWLADLNARLFSLWFVRRSRKLLMRRGGLVEKFKGETFLFSAFDRDFLAGVRACLLLAERSPEWRERARAALVLLFEGSREHYLREIEKDIRQRGLNDFNDCDLEGFKRMNAEKEAGEVLNDYLAVSGSSKGRAAL